MALRKYSGELGCFEYDDTDYAIGSFKDMPGKCLHYIGMEPDGEFIRVPNGLVDASCLFRNCTFLARPPKFPPGVEKYDKVFDGCRREVRVPGRWNIEHPGLQWTPDLALCESMNFEAVDDWNYSSGYMPSF